MAGDNSLIININGDAKNFLDELDKVGKETRDLEKILTTTAKASALAFAAFAGTIALVTKSFANYEKALVGVGKTTNIEGARLAKFGKEFQKLSSTIPVSTNELLGIAQAAGQLGVTGEENLLKFTETVAKLGVATDLTGEQAATSLTRILNVTGEGIDTIDTFGSVIVALGNNFAATESEIVRMATEVSRSTAVFGVSAAEASALGTALKSVGVQAQLGGSATGRAFRAIDKAVRGGGVALENLSRVTGMTGEQLQKTFKEDATGVFQSFIEGLGDIQRAGGSTTEALEAFGLKGDEILKVLPVLAKNSELLGDALATAAKETSNATALNDEAAKAFDTLGSEAQLVLNNFENLKTNIGEALAPAITELLSAVNSLLKSLAEMDKETISSIASFLKWGATLTASLATVASVTLAFIQMRKAIRLIRLAFTGARLAAIGFTSAATFGLSAIIGFLPEIIEGVSALVERFNKKDPPETLESITNELKNINEEIAALEERRGGLRGDEIVNLRDLKDRREELQGLRRDAIAASEGFGTGELLVRPKQDGIGDLDTSIPGLEQEVQAPFAPDAVNAQRQKEEAATKASEDKKQALIDESTAKRIEKLKASNAELQAVQEARFEGETEEEKNFLQRKAEINNEFTAAEKIKDAEERDLALENLTIKHAEELQAITEFENLKIENDALRREEKRALEEELSAEDKERFATLTTEEQTALAAKLDTQKQAEDKFAKERANKTIADRNQFKQDEIKFGTSIANLKQFFRKDEVQGVKNATANLVQLTNSRNSTLKGIGKAAARVQAAIKTAEGAISAYASLSGIPLIGPVLGAAAAGAIIAFGVEQQSKISSAQTGGFIPPRNAGDRDRVPALLEPGELVVPTALAPNFIQSVGQPQSGDFADDDVTSPDSGERTLNIQGDLVQNEEFVSALATVLRDQQEFDNVRI
jgi:TP901 family phage tail tape measure protein